MTCIIPCSETSPSPSTMSMEPPFVMHQRQTLHESGIRSATCGSCISASASPPSYCTGPGRSRLLNLYRRNDPGLEGFFACTHVPRTQQVLDTDASLKHACPYSMMHHCIADNLHRHVPIHQSVLEGRSVRVIRCGLRDIVSYRIVSWMTTKQCGIGSSCPVCATSNAKYKVSISKQPLPTLWEMRQASHDGSGISAT